MKFPKIFVLGTILLVLFSLWSPTSVTVARDLAIDAISPSFAYSNTDTDFVMKVTGDGFGQGDEVEIFYATEGFVEPMVKTVIVISATELRAEVEIPYSTQAGFYNVKITSPDGFTSITREGGLELRKKSAPYNFYPVVTSINPPNAPTDSTRNLIILGEQFDGDIPIVRLIDTAGPDWYDLDAVRLNHMEIHATTSPTIPAGVYDVLVRGTGGLGDNQFIVSSALTIEPASEPEPAPTLAPTPEPAPVMTPSDDNDSSSPTSGEAASTHNSAITVPQPKVAPAYFPDPSLFDYRASFVDQSGVVATGNDGILTHVVTGSRGSDIAVWIQFKNMSNRQWWYAKTLDPDDIHEVRLGLTKDTNSLFTHSDWISINRLTKISETVQPGGITTLQFRLHIPDSLAPGAYKLSVGLVAEWVKWMYDDVHWEVRVT